ncbi:hypothetical protein As57867_007089, partial [Aphanomyces stellatus]
LLIDLVNLLLSTTRNGSMDVTTPDLIVHMSYGQSPGVPLTFQPAYARQVLSTELNTLDRAIRDLRTSTHPFSIFAQYCSLDFQRRWDLAFYYEIGPFESIDMFLVAESVWTQPGFRDTFDAVQPISLLPMPPNFVGADLLYFGGNVLCLYNPPTSFPQSIISFDDACAAASQFAILASSEALLFAFFASRANDIRSVCVIQDTPGCIAALTQPKSLSCKKSKLGLPAT